MQIKPAEFTKSSLRAIEDFINTKYADKVIHRVGLCVGFHSLISASEGLIGHGTGIVNVNVDFRLVVWRPFKGEVVNGTISDSNGAGIYLTVDFFEDIVVPPNLMFENTSWDKDEQGTEAFIWKADDGAGGINEFFFDRAERCLFRVEQEVWTDLSPQMKRPDDYDATQVDEYGLRTGPYRIMASMMHTGLGPTLWWMGEDAPEEAVGDEVDQVMEDAQV